MKNKILFLSLLITSVGVYGQEIDEEVESLDELIIEENRLQIPFHQSTRNIQILTKEQIEKLPVSSINELLTYVGGVDVRQRGPFGMQADISIDGGSFEQTIVLWNGVKMSDAQTAHHSLNLPIPTSVIERIEILKGPAARIYGINALTGAVNIITKASFNDFVEIQTFAGSSFKNEEEGDGKGIYNGYGLQATLGLSSKSTNHLLSFGHQDSNGQRYNTAAESLKAMYQGQWSYNTNNKIEFLGGYTKNAFGANGFYAAPHDKESYEIVQTLLTSVSSTHHISDRWTIKPRISNRYNEDDYRFYRNDLSKARSLHYSNALMFEINSSYKTSIGDFGIGYETRIEEINSSNIGFHERNNHGWFAEYKNVWKESWFVNVGAYWNYNSDFGFQWYPGADVAYKFHDHWKASFSVGSSQRIPSFTDLYLNQRPGNIGNPNLQPEAAWQYEIGANYNNEGKQLSISAFERNISDFIDWTRLSTDVPYQPINLGNQRMRGIFTKWNQNILVSNSQKLNYQLSYQYLSPKKENSTDDLLSKYVIESLKHQLIVGFNYQYNQFGLQWQNRWIKREQANAYFVSDVRVMYAVRSLETYVQATNLFNASYKEIGAVPLPSRWVTLGLKYKLNFNESKH